jgi:hypothetical protein
MKYDISLTIQFDGSEADGEALAAVLPSAPFPVAVTVEEDRLIIKCHGIEASGFAALPEALRKTQVGLSPLFRQTVPTFAKRGGLLWSDITAADAHTSQ